MSQKTKEYEKFDRIGVVKQHAYFIPFSVDDKEKYTHGIVDRKSSSRFVSLDGVWQIKQHRNVDETDVFEELTETIPVPSCVQMHGYDQIQYINTRFPIPANPPYVPYANPCWHYRKKFGLQKHIGEKYYLTFEGVDSAFYLYVNGKYKGYSQISHAISEFDVTSLLVSGENTVDVLVLKWCASTYLECQDKFRFSGIFRSVYLVKRPKKHVTDYFIKTSFSGNDGVLTFLNESKVGITLSFCGQKAFADAGKTVVLTVPDVKKWSPEFPELYTLKLFAEGEKIIEKVGFREVKIENSVFKINGEPVKFKGVNRHDFNPKTGATVTLNNVVTDLKLMKKLNVNAVRTSHYPNMPEFYQLCDAMGIYVLAEADVEIHGGSQTHGTDSLTVWQEYANNKLFEKGIYSRQVALVERDKNRPCVVIWSLGNESSFGKAFVKGAKYIKSRDDRPLHYEGLNHMCGASRKKYLYSPLIDVWSNMYPSIGMMKDVLANKKETRPYVLCEYTHAMGNSNGDIADYWKFIDNEPRCMGGFVWEWADHAIKTRKGFLYGGDFGEAEHDGNFCSDGLLSPDRKIHSGAYEMQAVYGGKRVSEIKDVVCPTVKGNAKKVEFSVNDETGDLVSLKKDGQEMLKSPLKINLFRYIDNELHDQVYYRGQLGLHKAYSRVMSKTNTENGVKFDCVIAPNCLEPLVYYSIEYAVKGTKLFVKIAYKLADYVKYIPRFGVEFALGKEYADFSYIGFGPYESYVDKHVASEYGYYESTAEKNFTHYVHPQENGSHYATEWLNVKNAFTLTAEKRFSFSVLPYTTKQLYDSKHDFELKKTGITNVCVDLAMRGVGSHSCGPVLDSCYEIPRTGENTFVFEF